MNSKRAFELVYAPQVKEHLKAIERKYYGLIRREIEVQLQFEPEVETRNRKPLRRAVAFEAEWELRSGRTAGSECSTKSIATPELSTYWR